ncbi:MAG: hypothetical protein AABX04_06460 [Nanoarchaeota archaeon]
MGLESLQGGIYFVLALIATLTAVLGLLFVNHLSKKRAKETISNSYSFFFLALGFGYACFALAELSWFLIFKLFGESASGSMPDFYWVIGAVSLFLGFTVFYLFTSSKQGKGHWIIILMILFALSSLILYYLLGANVIPHDTSTGQTFLGYFYPMISALILISSIGAYFFMANHEDFSTPLLLMVIANALFFTGDLTYSYASFESVYGFIGFFSDLIYILAYLSCCLSFYYFLTRIKGE